LGDRGRRLGEMGKRAGKERVGVVCGNGRIWAINFWKFN
jgi:hypothetical protein